MCNRKQYTITVSTYVEAEDMETARLIVEQELPASSKVRFVVQGSSRLHMKGLRED